MSPEGGPPPTVHIHYRRLPHRDAVFDQLLLRDGEDVKVTFAASVRREEPVRVGGDVVLEDGSDVVWFTFPGAWHDIGRFHTADGVFRGFYANILTPPTFHPGRVWRTTDLVLDVWLPPGGPPSVLDRVAFDEAVRRGWLHRQTRRRALEEVEAILDGVRRGAWPPAVSLEWTRERAREVAGVGRAAS